MTNEADILRQALALHQAGQLSQAEALYRQLLQSHPDHAPTLHLLGLVAQQTGRHELAVRLIAQAIQLDNRQPVWHSNLGEAFRALGRTAEAQACYQQALRLDPRFTPAHYNLGLLLAGQDPAAARACYQRAIELEPRHAPAHNNLGNVLLAQGKLDEAIAAYQHALSIQPDYAEALANLGAAWLEKRQFDAALPALQAALRIHPQSAATHFSLGRAYGLQAQWERAASHFAAAVQAAPGWSDAHLQLAATLQSQGQLDRAAEAFEAALRIAPGHLDTLLRYAALLVEQRRLDAAEALYLRAAQIAPDRADVHFNLAHIHQLQRRGDAAERALQECLRIRPDWAEAYINLAIIYNQAGQHDQALALCEQGMQLSSRSAAAFGNRALAYHAQGRYDEAIDCYRRSLELRPDDAAEHSNLVYALNFNADDPQPLFEEHLAWAQRHAEPLTASAPPLSNDRTPDRRLRIGYVSGHFREHAVNFFVEPILTSHDHRQFEVFCYSDVVGPDATTARLQRAADVWRDTAKLSHEELAAVIRADKIDLLIDLAGHMGRPRLLTFARRPAPVQVTYIGYQNSTGMSAMDYRLTDALADPPGLTDRFYTERLIRLPRAFFCFQPFETPPLTPLPAAERGHVTFGSFNNYAKVMPATLEAWLEILARVPRSRLLILSYRGGELERHIHELASRRGIDRERIELYDKRPRQEYLRLVTQADIALDPFPFNGHTTTCDCIWMGVPVVMLLGNAYYSRFGGSVLANVGLEELMARSPREYIQTAVDLAQDPARLAHWRSTLRATMAASPLLDFAGFTRHLEAAYRQMWHDWCRWAGPSL